MTLLLPEWASEGAVLKGGRQVIDVRADGAYTAWLEELGVAIMSPEEALDVLEDSAALQDVLDGRRRIPDQYWLAVAEQCIKMDIQAARGRFIEIHIHHDDYKWQHNRYPVGRGEKAAIEVRRSLVPPECKQHFYRRRGFIPWDPS